LTPLNTDFMPICLALSSNCQSSGRCPARVSGIRPWPCVESGIRRESMGPLPRNSVP